MFSSKNELIFGSSRNSIGISSRVTFPDSPRYFYADTYQELQDNNKGQKQLSKEFVREWLIENGFQGKEGQKIPEMNNEIINSLSDRYIELYESIIGDKFIKRDTKNMLSDIESNIKSVL